LIYQFFGVNSQDQSLAHWLSSTHETVDAKRQRREFTTDEDDFIDENTRDAGLRHSQPAAYPEDGDISGLQRFPECARLPLNRRLIKRGRPRPVCFPMFVREKHMNPSRSGKEAAGLCGCSLPSLPSGWMQRDRPPGSTCLSSFFNCTTPVSVTPTVPSPNTMLTRTQRLKAFSGQRRRAHHVRSPELATEFSAEHQPAGVTPGCKSDASALEHATTRSH